MERLDKNSFTTSRKFTYTYYHLNRRNGQPTLLLLHGFPDDHNLWGSILPYLLESSFSVLIPDLLGYNGTSKPLDAACYNSKGMADDLGEILENEKINKAIPVGHDWGSFLAQRMWLWHPNKVVGVVLLNVAYDPPASFDLHKMNEAAEKSTGLPRLAYWEFFTAPDCAEVLHHHMDSWYEALHGNLDTWLETLFCHRGALSHFVRQGMRVQLKAYAESLRAEWVSCFGKFGFVGPLQWYRAQVGGHHWGVEKDIPESRFWVTVPVLFIGARRDTVCRTEAIQIPEQKGLLPDLTVEEVESGHWPTLETPHVTGPIIVRWLEGKADSFAMLPHI